MNVPFQAWRDQEEHIRYVPVPVLLLILILEHDRSFFFLVETMQCRGAFISIILYHMVRLSDSPMNPVRFAPIAVAFYYYFSYQKNSSVSA